VIFDSEERDIVVDSPHVRAIFTNRGAELKSWQLKRYFDDREQPIDLFPAGIPATEPRPFSLILDDQSITQQLRHALFRVSAIRMNVDRGERELSFEYEDVGGLKATKQFRFAHKGQPYLVEFSAAVEWAGSALPLAVSSGPGIGDTARAVGSSSFLSPSYYQKPEALIQRGRDVTRIPAPQLANQGVHEGIFTCIGTDDQYFLGVVLPGARNTRVVYEAAVLPTSWPQRIASWFGPSTSASSTGWSSPCCRRSTGSTASSAITAGQSLR
jgi:YidC/Oxa1 family membrane protein insertase